MLKRSKNNNRNDAEQKVELNNVSVIDNCATGEVFKAGVKSASAEMQDEKVYGEAMLKNIYMFFANTYSLIGVRCEYMGYHLLLDIQRNYSAWHILEIDRCEALTSNKTGVSINTLKACIEDCLDKEVVSIALSKVMKRIFGCDKYEVKDYVDVVRAVDELFKYYFSTIVQ